MKTLNRRKFLQQNLALTGCLVSGFNIFTGVRTAKAASVDGYKALVCVYLAGGNDSFNMFVPASAAAHADYASARQFLTIPRAQFDGWDTHSAQVEDSAGSHANLLGKLDHSFGVFHAALQELGLENQVTTFTATEFGRSLTPNGSGSDHGWGGHSLVMGGAVAGSDIYGTMPQLSFDSDDAVENNRIIRTSSVDQYGATPARWFGLSESELNSVFPNLQNFASPDLGFML